MQCSFVPFSYRYNLQYLASGHSLTFTAVAEFLSAYAEIKKKTNKTSEKAQSKVLHFSTTHVLDMIWTWIYPVILGLFCFCKGKEILEFLIFFLPDSFQKLIFLVLGKMVSLVTLGEKNIAPLSNILCSPSRIHCPAAVKK